MVGMNQNRHKRFAQQKNFPTPLSFTVGTSFPYFQKMKVQLRCLGFLAQSSILLSKAGSGQIKNETFHNLSFYRIDRCLRNQDEEQSEWGKAISQQVQQRKIAFEHCPQMISIPCYNMPGIVSIVQVLRRMLLVHQYDITIVIGQNQRPFNCSFCPNSECFLSTYFWLGKNSDWDSKSVQP